MKKAAPKMNPFKGKESKKEEAAERKAFPTKAGYAKMEKRFEPGKKKG
jgi:hypothetical protein